MKETASLGIKLLCGFLGLLFFLLAAFCTITGIYMAGMGYFESMPDTFTDSYEFEIITDELGIGLIRFNLDYSSYTEGEVVYYDYHRDDYPSGFYYTVSLLSDLGDTRVFSNFESLPDKELYSDVKYANITYVIKTGETLFEHELNYWQNGTALTDADLTNLDFRIDYWVDTEVSSTSSYGLARSFYSCMSYLKGNVVALGILGYIGLFACLIFLFLGVGRRGGELYLNFFDRMPWGISALISLIPGGVGIALLTLIHDLLGHSSSNLVFIILLGALAAAVLFYISFVTFLSTTIARLKNRSFIKTTLIYYLFSAIGKGAYKLGVVWRTALLWGGLLAFIFICHWEFRYDWSMSVILSFFSCLLIFCLVIWGAIQLKHVRKGADALAKGHLDKKTETFGLTGDYRSLASDLNMINQSISLAVEERMKSERLKTELITNVSHDVKTPLTSIINYVDLLKKEELPTDQAREYLAILDRQSQRLKKMLDDLTEASKAATGNIEPKREEVDLSELLLQSIGEYAEKMGAANLDCILEKPDEPVIITADGTLVWRCVNNLLSNMTKYSMPGTRAYVTLEDKGSYVSIIFRNVSRDRIKVSPEELTERFVRGDSSRNSEGSGLGLAIVKSFAELMKGYFGLTVDGDLFKAELRFNKE